MKKLVFVSLIAVLVSACLGSDFADSVEGSWQMTSGTLDGEEIPILDSHPITMVIEGNQISGTASCNGYSGTFDLDGSEITIGPLATTQMACFPEETMQAETMFGEAMTRVETVTLDDELTLSGDGVELVFVALQPVPDAELTNTVWQLDGLISHDAVSTPVLGTNATIEFFTDGSMLGDTGCRPFSGQYTISGDEVTVTGITSDGQECEPDVAAQDELFLAVIESGFRFEIEGINLTTWSESSDDLGLVFLAA